MNANALWQMFLETGAPEMYLLYHEARRLEEPNVSDGSGIGSAHNQLQ